MTEVAIDLFREVIDYSPTTERRVVSILGMLKVYDCRSLQKKRFGRAFDGGYVMADDFDGITAAYSFGISDDVSWDIDIADIGIDIHQYDHTIDGLPTTHSRFNWRKIGLSHANQEDGSLQRLERLLSDNGHDETADLVLKCDIEGHEWSVFSDLTISLLKRFRQIVVELHALQSLSDCEQAETIRRAVVNLTAHHNVIHVHANNWAPWAILGSIPIPTVLELTLLRKDRGTFLDSSESFPTALDMPNNPDRADFPLGNFRF